MKEIQTVGIIGLGALGILYTELFTRALGRDRVLVLADRDRIARYRETPFTFNGARCLFRLEDAAQVSEPVDLLLFAVKFGGFRDSIETCRHLVGPETTLVSVLNGIESEGILEETFSPEQVIWCVAQKMSAVKEGPDVTVRPLGELALGIPEGRPDRHLRRLTAFLDGIDFPYVLPGDIRTHMWGKLMVNTGCNQAAMVYRCGYLALQKTGPARDAMIGAMREVAAVAEAEGITLTEEDLLRWLTVIDGLNPAGEPSMRQDARARRKSEVELFSGTIRRLGRLHHIPTPVNDLFYERICAMEAEY